MPIIKLYLFLLFTPFYCFAQTPIYLELDTFIRSIPDVGFNGSIVRGPGWIDSTFNDSVATMNPEILRYPGGNHADAWDWDSGWFYPQTALDTAIAGTTYTINSGLLNLTPIDSRPIIFQRALDQIEAEGIFGLNIISSDIATQSADLRNAINDGVIIDKVEIGCEVNHENTFKMIKFPTAGDYARACNKYIDSLKVILPDAKIAVVAGNRVSSITTRAEHWNDSIFSIVDSADALIWHCYLYLNDGDTSFTTKQLLAYSLYRVPLYEKWRGFNDTISELQDYNIWVTEYNIFDKTTDKRFSNTWAHALILSGMNYEFMQNKLVNMMLLHNVGGIFQGFDAINTNDNFRKRGTGLFASIWNKSTENMEEAHLIKPLIIDTISYTNNNGIVNTIDYYKLYAWKFKNTTDESLVITNISSDSIVISIDSVFMGTKVYWEKWYTDSLLTQIDSNFSIHIQKDSGKSNILILPYSISVASSNICSHISSNQIFNICEGDSVLVGNNTYFLDTIYIDTLKGVLACDSILNTEIIFFQNTIPSINYQSDSLITEQGMVAYQWYLNGTVIQNATQYFHQASINGNYTVTYLDSNSCYSESNIYYYNNVRILESSPKQRTLLRIVDILGRETTILNNIILIYIYSDGSVEKKIFTQL